jgi:hypothetical protein
MSSETLNPLISSRHEACARSQRTIKQSFGVNVGVVGRANAEVKRTTSDANDIARTHSIARTHRDRCKKRIARAQSIGVFDCDVQRATHLSGKDHAPIGCRSDLPTWTRSVIDAPISSHPRFRRRTKVVNDFSIAWRPILNRC